MIQISAISKGFGGQLLLDNCSFNINDKERIGLVGRNGHGKTTLFRLMLGQEKVDAGQFIFPSRFKLGHLEQKISFTEDTVIAEGCRGLPSEEVSSEEASKDYKVKKILSGLGFTENDFGRSPSEFSGGFQVRLNLVKVLVSEPDLLLLDEPTNYLDILSIRWLKHFLRSWPKAFIIITHDREFMDQVTTHTMGIHRGKIKKVMGNTEKYYSQIQMEEEVHEKTLKNIEQKRKKDEQFINRFRAKATKARAVQSRIKMLDKKPKLSMLEKIKELSFSFNQADFAAKNILKVENISFDYNNVNIDTDSDSDQHFLIQDFDLIVGRQDRVAIVGANGKGKTTLLQLLAKELKPIKGSISYHDQAQIAYFGQPNIERLNPELTIEQELIGANPSLSLGKAKSVAGHMMFGGDLANKPISILSGGEKSRVMLGKLLLGPANILLLDEPTNHLDMYSTLSLVHAVKKFSGAVIIVTHSEMILKELATRLIVFKDKKLFEFNGTYEDFLVKEGWEESESEITTKNKSKLNKKDLRKKRSEIIGRRSSLLKPLAEQIKSIESDIDKLEKHIEEDNKWLIQASNEGNGKKAAALSQVISINKNKVDALFNKLVPLTEEHDKIEKELNQQLEDIGSK